MSVKFSTHAIAEMRAAVAAGAGHECEEWWSEGGVCALCDRPRGLTIEDQLAILRRAGYVPYARKGIMGRELEIISYPFPRDDGAGVGCMVREPGDPTTMFEWRVPEAIFHPASLALGLAEQIAIIFRGPHGFVTDFGAPVDLTPVSPDTATISIPRFGVWRFDPSKGKHQVTHTTNDEAEAIARASEPPPI